MHIEHPKKSKILVNEDTIIDIFAACSVYKIDFVGLWLTPKISAECSDSKFKKIGDGLTELLKMQSHNKFIELILDFSYGERFPNLETVKYIPEFV